MGQLNINLTPEFEKDLETYMKEEGLTQKSEAIRRALREAALRHRAAKPKTDFRNWRGLALKSPPNPKPRFKSEDDLWSY